MDEVGSANDHLTDATDCGFDRLVDLYLKTYRIVFSCTAASILPTAAQPTTRNGLSALRCYEKGARIGELSDKGWGYNGSSAHPLPGQSTASSRRSPARPVLEEVRRAEDSVNTHSPIIPPAGNPWV
jgi:hypothetical protein